MKIVAKNRRATFDYAITDKMIAGLVLLGSEVKSAKASHVQLKGSYVRAKLDEAVLVNSHISHYANAGVRNQHDPERERKLLLTKKQLNDLFTAKQNGHHIIPMAMGIDHGLLKLEIGIGTSKKRYDKRETIKKREAERIAIRM